MLVCRNLIRWNQSRFVRSSLRRSNLTPMASCSAARIVTTEAGEHSNNHEKRSSRLKQDAETMSKFHYSHHKIVATLRQIPAKYEDLKLKAARDIETYGEDLHNVTTRGGMFVRQLRMEEEQHDEAVSSYSESTKQLVRMGKGTGLKHIQRLMLQWYEPLIKEISAEVKLVQNKVAGKDRVQYGPCLLLLPPEKLAVITLHSCLNSTLKTGNIGISVVTLASYIGDLIEAEVNIMKLQKGKDQLRPWQQEIMKEALQNLRQRGRSINSRIGRLIDSDHWETSIKVKLGAALLSLLLRTAKKDNGDPSFFHHVMFSSQSSRRIGTIRLDTELFTSIADKNINFVMPRYLPMLVPPKNWDNKRRFGCYFRLKANLMRTFSQDQHDALAKADIGGILESLNYLGRTPWRINVKVLEIAKEAWKRGLLVGELPPVNNLELPKEEDCFRIPQKKVYRPPIRRMKPPGEEGVDPELDDFANAQEVREAAVAAEERYQQAVAYYEEAVRNQESKSEEYWTTPSFDKRYFDEMTKRVRTKNAELHSLRCDMHLKLWVAEKFSDDQVYFPYSLDFRGRAYPVPPNLNHLGSDLCRGVLLFGESKPLGPKGLHWLMVHMSNLHGNNKISHAKRVEWTESHMDDIFDSATNPLDGRRWWATAEEPFQCLATCIEIHSALQSGNPESYQCRLPVHQDGSCNGLQHYAALGRDKQGADAVNLTESQFPQDVYSKVLEIVQKKIAVDTHISEECENPVDRLRGKHARMVNDIVNRKVIKQTVMTSVYGVTRAGASMQVQARLEEKLLQDPSAITDPEMEKEIAACARYVAALTLDSLREMFTSAKSIMDWLGTCAALVASQGQVMSWVTPMGLPVLQPYRKPSTHTIRTMLQSITLAVNDDSLPVSGQKQKSAFPPNFVHSLDASHMLMTSLRMKERGLTFAAVHDSYWTHPCDIDTMNDCLRECFVELYEQPILQSLHSSLEMRYPELEFPPIPDRGDLDINDVKNSPYFFH